MYAPRRYEIFGIDDMAFGALAGGALSFLGGERRNAASADSQEYSTAVQSQLAMHAHEYEIEDLKRSGLNPMLTGKYGGAPMVTPPMRQVEDSVTPAVTTALSGMQMKANIDLLNSQAMKARAEAAEASERTQNYEFDRDYRMWETDAVKKGIPGIHYESERKGLLMAREADLRQALSPERGRALAQQYGSTHLLRDPLVAKYLMELPALQSEMRLRGSLSTLHELEAPRARNAARAESSWWKREVAPYLRDAAQSVGTGSRAYWLLGR